MDGRVFYVGTDREVAHHARPLAAHVDLRIAPPDEVLGLARVGDVAVFYSEHFDRFRSLCVELKRRNIATVYAIDGVLEWRNAWVNHPDEIACPWTMRPCLSHAIAAIGPRQCAILRSWGNDPVLPVGLPRLDSLCRARLATGLGRESDAPTLPPTSGGGNSPAPFKVLVMTAKCPGFTEAQIEVTYQSLRAVQAATHSLRAELQRPIEWVWRLTGGLDERLGISSVSVDPATALEATDLPSLIRHCDAVLTTPSTAMLEAMLCARPVALLDFHNTPVLADAAFRISAPEHISGVMRRLVQYSTQPAYRAMQAFLLQENLMADGQATQRMVALLESLQRQSQVAAARGQWLKFDPTDWWAQGPTEATVDPEWYWSLRPRRIGPAGRKEDSQPSQAEQGFPAGQSPSSSSTSIEANDAEALASNLSDLPLSLPQWQAYTEQLERENQRLQRLVSEAHLVFEHMQGHPILGTLLKSHEWWSRWWRGSPGALAKPPSWNEP